MQYLDDYSTAWKEAVDLTNITKRSHAIYTQGHRYVVGEICELPIGIAPLTVVNPHELKVPYGYPRLSIVTLGSA